MSTQWYARYPGDYMRDTAHLSLMEHGVYTKLLDLYYASGKPIPAGIEGLARMCAAMTTEERAAVESVASQFFPVNGDGMRHNARADKEIARRSECASHLSERGRKGALAMHAKRCNKRKPKHATSIQQACNGHGMSTSTSTSTSREPQPEEEKAANESPRATWMTPFSDSWTAKMGGELPFKKSARPLSAAVKAHGAEEALRVWNVYLEVKDPEFASAADYWEKFSTWGKEKPARQQQRQLIGTGGL